MEKVFGVLRSPTLTLPRRTRGGDRRVPKLPGKGQSMNASARIA
jgi:hypothetical protein